MATGTLEAKDTKAGPKGPYLRAKIGGKWYSLFKPEHKAVVENAQPGAVLKFETEVNGQYTNVTSIELDGNTPAAEVGGGGGGGGNSSRDLSVRVSYAKDLLAAGKVATPSEAVQLVDTLVSLTRASMEAEAQAEGS